MKAFEAMSNPFGGIVPVPDALPEDHGDFRRRLDYSLREWRSEGYKLVWLEVPIGKSGHIPLAVEVGFFFHHSGDGYLMMVRRLEEDAFVPAYASHYIGAGGVVVNGANELLVVRERRGRPGQGGSFKLPGGAVSAGEHLAEGVMREVLEETGVRTRFVALSCFRSQHGYRYGKSDIYFVCRLEPLSYEIRMQAEEIEECVWMALDRYLGSEKVSQFNKSIVVAALESPGLAPARIDGYSDPETREFFMPLGGRPLPGISLDGDAAVPR